ncbi:MAG: flagellar export protein FliJ [Phycisphaerae bacterium]|nr:flagellar export protein FliJ [Phycisphaerae bacterium]
MAGFRFKLDPVLKHRGMIENQCQHNLAKLMRQRHIMHTQLRQMQETISRSKHQLASALVGRVDVNQIHQFSRHSGPVVLREQKIVIALAQLEVRIDAARQALLDATRNRKALQLLRDKEFRLWRRLTNVRDVARVDEITSQRYARELAEAGLEAPS